MIKRVVSLICVGVAAFAFDFAKDGKALCSIAVADAPNKFEEMAAKDLQEHLGKMTGASFAVVNESEAKGNAIYLGRTKFAGANGVDFNGFAKEEWMLKTVGDSVVVSGGRPIGTFYGVWALLTKLGCWPLTMEQTIIPSKPTLSLQDFDERRAPSFAGRAIYDGLAVSLPIMGIPEKEREEYRMWLLRSGINGRQHRLIPPLYEGDMIKITTDPTWHTMCLYVNPDKYFDKHPEYFSMDEKGNRCRPQTLTARGGLCLSNKEVMEIALESLRGFIKRDRAKFPEDEWPVVYDMTALDLAPKGLCNCPECNSIKNSEYGGGLGLLLHFINYIAEKIDKEYPGVIIRTYDYGGAREALANTKARPAKNVLIQFCDYFVQCDCFHPLDHPFNTLPYKRITDWKAAGTRLAVWDYWNMSMYFNPPRVETITDTIKKDLEIYRNNNVEVMFIEAERHNYKPQNFIDMNYFLASRLMMRIDDDAEQLIDIFINGYYGKAAPTMKALLKQLRRDIAAYPKLQPGMRSELWSYMTNDYLVDTYKKLRAAAELEPKGSITRRHVTDEMLPILWLVTEKSFRYGKAFEAAGVPIDEIRRNCLEYSKLHLARFNGQKLDAESPYAKTRFDMQSEYDQYTGKPMPPPEKFAKIPDEKIRVFGKPHYIQQPNYHSTIVKDADSPTGEAICCAIPDATKHGYDAILRDPNGKWAFWGTQFAAGIPGKESGIRVKDIPTDEKFHWYRIPKKLTIGESSYFWGCYWYLQILLSSAYRVDDGESNENDWICWFSAKFTGPAYVPGSTQRNSISVDTVVLVKEDAEKLIQ
ncbi:MAG: DUF4838 domain-containing protein [Victivallales bacterium]|nr:DUF4838 domain-containing protein [Victivallales bacterium]